MLKHFPVLRLDLSIPTGIYPQKNWQIQTKHWQKKKNKKKLANPKPNIGKQKLKKNWQTQIYFKISLKKNCNYNCLKELLTFSYSIIKVNFLPTDCYICEVVSQLATF